MSLLKRPQASRTLLTLVGKAEPAVPSSTGLAAYVRRGGCMVDIGGPHVMTCDTSMLAGRGVSFAQSEAALIWSEILFPSAGTNSWWTRRSPGAQQNDT